MYVLISYPRIFKYFVKKKNGAYFASVKKYVGLDLVEERK